MQGFCKTRHDKTSAARAAAHTRLPRHAQHGSWVMAMAWPPVMPPVGRATEHNMLRGTCCVDGSSKHSQKQHRTVTEACPCASAVYHARKRGISAEVQKLRCSARPPARERPYNPPPPLFWCDSVSGFFIWVASCLAKRRWRTALVPPSRGAILQSDLADLEVLAPASCARELSPSR